MSDPSGQDPVYDYYDRKRRLADAWMRERDYCRTTLDGTTGDVEREVLERRLRLAEHELEAAQYVGD